MKLSSRASFAIWAIYYRELDYCGCQKQIPWKNERKLKRGVLDWIKSGGQLRKIRNVGIFTEREIQKWLSLPLTPLLGELPICPHCGQRLKGGAK